MLANIDIKLLSQSTSQNTTTNTTSNVTPATAAANENHGSDGYMEEEGEEEEDYDDNNDDEMHIGIGRNNNRRRSSATIPEPLTIGEIPELHLKFNTHFDITDHWHQYKAKSLDIANRLKLHISSDLQKVM